MKLTFKSFPQICLTIGLAALLSSPIQAEEMRKPPKEALDACSSKADGDSCSFTGLQNNTLKGTCRKCYQGPLACVPTPPKEAFDACSGKAENDSCTVNMPDNNKINGSCRKGPSGEAGLACIPAQPPKEEGNEPAGNTDNNKEPAGEPTDHNEEQD